MSTYKGGEVPDKEDINPGKGPISGRRDRPISDDLEMGTEDAEPDAVPKPGQKGYKQHMREKMYDHPRSKGAQEAKKGDVREIDGEEYESVGGTMSDADRKSEDNRATGTPDKVEYWKKRKREIPTS